MELRVFEGVGIEAYVRGRGRGIGAYECAGLRPRYGGIGTCVGGAESRDGGMVGREIAGCLYACRRLQAWSYIFAIEVSCDL